MTNNDERNIATGSKRAIVFLRVRAPENEVEGHLAGQRAECRRAADLLGARVVAEFVAIGGTNEQHVGTVRDGALKVLETIRVHYLITVTFDRLCRRPEDWAKVIRCLGDRDAALVTGGGVFTADTMQYVMCTS